MSFRFLQALFGIELLIDVYMECTVSKHCVCHIFGND